MNKSPRRNGSSNVSDESFYHTLAWGLANKEIESPHSKMIISYCRIEREYYATTDGINVALWNPNKIMQIINIPAAALFFFPKLSQIAAFVNETHKLHFISIHQPYGVRNHPLNFTERIISKMHFFPKTSTIVSVGEGLLFSRLVIPPYFKEAEPMPETLQFHKISQIYDNITFSDFFSSNKSNFTNNINNFNRVCFVDESCVVVVNIFDTIYIHTSNGTEVQRIITNSFITNDRITSISLISEQLLHSKTLNSIENMNIANISKESGEYSCYNRLIMGTKNGKVAILKFELPNPFVPNAPPEKCNNVSSFSVSKFPVILSELFERNFLVVVDSDRGISVFSIKNGIILQKIRCSIDAINGFIFDDLLILYSQYSLLTSYQCSLFLSHFSDIGCDCTDINRSSSATRSARFVCFLKNNNVSLVAAKDGKIVFGVTTSNNSPDIRNVCYCRDIQIDGSYVSRKNVSDDIFFIQLDQGITYIFEFDHIDRSLTSSISPSNEIGNLKKISNIKNYANKDFVETFISSLKGFEAYWIPQTSIETPFLSPFISFIDIGENKVCGIIESGVCFIYSFSTKKLLENFSLNEKEIICAIFSFSNNSLVVSSIGKVFTFNIKNKTLCSHTNPNTDKNIIVTSMILINESTIFFGLANGNVEVRTFPNFHLKQSSQMFNTCHTENGHRSPLQDSYLSTRQLYEAPSCVKKLDFCNRREVVLSLSVYGEIFIWEKSGRPIIRINIPFSVSSACFADGNGSILVSALDNLFLIEWRKLFQKYFLPIQTLLDDFDLRIDTFDLKHINQRDPPTIKTISSEEHDFMNFEGRKFRDNINENFDFNKPFKNNYQDLIVDLEVLPKRHFAPLRFDEMEEMSQKIKIPTQNIDDIIEEEKRIEAEKNKKKPKAKKLMARSRRKNNPDSLFSKSSSSQKKSNNKYEEFYGNDDDDEGFHRKRYRKKTTKSKSKKSTSKKSTFSDIDMKDKYDAQSEQPEPELQSNRKSDVMTKYEKFNFTNKNPRFNSTRYKNVIKSSAKINSNNFSKSFNDIPTISNSYQLSTKAFKTVAESVCAPDDMNDSDSFSFEIPTPIETYDINKSSILINEDDTSYFPNKGNFIKTRKNIHENNTNSTKENTVIVHEPLGNDNRNLDSSSIKIHEPEEKQNENPKPIKARPKIQDYFITQPEKTSSFDRINSKEEDNEYDGNDDNDDYGSNSIEDEVENEQNHKFPKDNLSFKLSGSSKRDVSNRPTNSIPFVKYERRVTPDDAMFTNFKIDGFNQPFGGFINRSGSGIQGINANAPLVHINAKKEQKPQRSRGLYVRKVPKRVKIAPACQTTGIRTINDKQNPSIVIGNYFTTG